MNMIPRWFDLDRCSTRLDVSGWENGPWFKREALTALHRGWYQAINGRTDDDLYLLRLWLTPPAPGEDGKFDSGNSLLLHCFARGDDDEALHDHPWNFRTTLLSGGYIENLPPPSWQKGELGPQWDQRCEVRITGDTIDRGAEDLHCVGRIAPNTWTLVRTGPRVRDWGFHPHGLPWVGWRSYLGIAT